MKITEVLDIEYQKHIKILNIRAKDQIKIEGQNFEKIAVVSQQQFFAPWVLCVELEVHVHARQQPYDIAAAAVSRLITPCLATLL